MVKILIGLGLALIPFITIPGSDTRLPKMELALAIALATSLLVIYQGKLRAFSNKWILIFVWFLLVNIHLAPKAVLNYGKMSISNFWVWKPTFFILTFALLIITITSLKWTKKELKIMFSIMVWAGFIMSLYLFAQALDWEQFFLIRNYPAHHYKWPLQMHIGGTLGQPTIVAPFIAMLIPIAFYMRQHIKAILMIFAVFLTNSQVAYGAMVFSLLFYLGTFGKIRFIISSVIVLSLAGTLIIGYQMNPKINEFVGDSGRFKNWKNIYNTVTKPLQKGDKHKFPLTGLGIGSFYYSYHLIYKNTYKQAHNDYSELHYHCGIIGIGLFLMAIWQMFKMNFSLKKIFSGKANKLRMVLLSSFVCIAIGAGGTFVWQLGVYIFYTVFIVGLLHKKEGELCPLFRQ